MKTARRILCSIFVCYFICGFALAKTSLYIPQDIEAFQLYADTSSAAVRALYAKLPQEDSRVQIMVYTGSSTEETVNTIAEALPLLTGLRYDIYLAAASHYADGQVLITIQRKEPAHDNFALARAQEIAEDAKMYSEDKAEQLQYINAVLCQATYDHISVQNREQSDGLAWSAYGCLIRKNAVCSGYAHAFTLICEALEIPVIEVSGFGAKGGAHLWNMVCIEGEWLAVDITANASSMRKGGTPEAVFLLPPQALERRGYRAAMDWQTLVRMKY